MFSLTSARLYFSILAILFSVPPLLAHAPDQSYVFMRILQDGIEGSFEITVEDLNTVFSLNLPDGVGEAELAPHLERIHAYYREKTAFQIDGKSMPIEFTTIDFLDIKQGYFINFNFRLLEVDSIPDKMTVRYAAIFEESPQHRAMLVEMYNWKAGLHAAETNIKLRFTPSDTVQTYDLTEGSVWQGFWAMIKSGMWHIWIGLDHILFLLALLLPSVLRRMGDKSESPTSPAKVMKSWAPVDKFRPAFIYVLKIVTLFTVAHTITLALAALEVIQLPGWLVESIIALSIAMAAFHNIRPFLRNETLIIAFGFGLFHGFGFASVLGEVGLQGEYIAYSLLGFNLGVEMCQILIISAIFPILFLLRKRSIYPYIFFYTSILLIIISLYWVTERAFDVELKVDNYLAYKYKVLKQSIVKAFTAG